MKAQSRTERRQRKKNALFNLFVLAIGWLVFFKFLYVVFHMMQGEVYYK
ncbi:hypothetical protein Q9R38_26045 [Priestia aryabhattai]|nr:hypothetical protein [Priestia aryabhattai]MDT0150006.1 hypothetical protein [Priestia aryabhattai]MDT0155576.1 hypothetical protein [Priestia aryabhattai]